MPYTATTPTLTLCDKLVAVVNTAWAPTGNNAVERDYLYRFNQSTLTGRKVILFPTGYDNGPATRAEDEFIHRITAVVVERYTDAGEPSKEWIDERVDFVFDKIVQGLDYSHDGPLLWSGRHVLTLGAEVQVVDFDRLTQTKLFYAAVAMEFSEIQNA